MDLAALDGHAPVVEYLLKENVSPNPVDKNKVRRMMVILEIT